MHFMLQVILRVDVIAVAASWRRAMFYCGRVAGHHATCGEEVRAEPCYGTATRCLAESVTLGVRRRFCSLEIP